jgi:CDP-diglyceride synthetase
MALIAVVALCWAIYLHDGPSSLALVAGAMVLWPAAFFATNVVMGARRSAGAHRGKHWLFPIVSCLAAPLLVWSALNSSFDAQYWDWHGGLILVIWALIVCGYLVGRLIARRRRSLNPNPRALKK